MKKSTSTTPCSCAFKLFVLVLNPELFVSLHKKQQMNMIFDSSTSIIDDHIRKERFKHYASKYRSTIMGLAMLSIMLFHQYFMSCIPFNFFHNFGFWGVDVFLFLSGMGLVKSLNNNSLRIYYSRRFSRIIPSCIVCGATKYFIFLLLGSSVAVLKDGLHIGIWSIMSLDLWFIPTIIILYTISPLLYYSLNKWTCITIMLVLFVFSLNGVFIKPKVGYDWISPIGILAWTTERLPVFMAGMYIAMKKDWIDSKIRYSYMFLFFAVGINCLEKIGSTFPGIPACNFFALMMGMPGLITLCTFLIARIPIFFLRVFNFFGTYSLELYLVHEFIFWTLKINYNDSNPFSIMILSFALSCLSSFLCKSITIRLKCSLEKDEK